MQISLKDQNETVVFSLVCVGVAFLKGIKSLWLESVTTRNAIAREVYSQAVVMKKDSHGAEVRSAAISIFLVSSLG